MIGQAEVGRLGASEMVTAGGGKGEEAQAAVREGAKGACHGGEGGAEGDDIVDDEQPASGDGIDIAQGEDAFDVGVTFARVVCEGLSTVRSIQSVRTGTQSCSAMPRAMCSLWL